MRRVRGGPHQTEQRRQQDGPVAHAEGHGDEEHLEHDPEDVGGAQAQQGHGQEGGGCAVEHRRADVAQRRAHPLRPRALLEHEAVRDVRGVVHGQAHGQHQVDHGHVVDDQAPVVHGPHDVHHRGAHAGHHQEGRARVRDEHAGDQEDGHQAQGQALGQLLLDHLEGLPVKVVVRPREGVNIPLVHNCTQVVHGGDLLVRVVDQLAVAVLGEALVLRLDAGGAEAALGGAVEDQGGVVLVAHAAGVGAEVGVELGLVGGAAVRVNGDAGTVGVHQGDVIEVVVVPAVVGGAGNILNVGRLILHSCQSGCDGSNIFLVGKIVKVFSYYVHIRTNLPKILINLVQGVEQVGAVRDERARGVLHGELGGARGARCQQAREADNDGDPHPAGSDGRAILITEEFIELSQVLLPATDRAVWRRGPLLCCGGLPLLSLGRPPAAHEAAGAAVGPAGDGALGVDRQEGGEEGDLEEEEEEDADGRVEAEAAERAQAGGGGDEEGHEVGDGGDGDGDGRVAQRPGRPLRHRQVLGHLVEGVGDDEGVVHAQAQQHEGQHAVQRGVVEAQAAAEPVAGPDGQAHAEQPRQRQPVPGVHPVAGLAQTEAEVEEHDHEGDVDEDDVARDGAAELCKEGRGGLRIQHQVIVFGLHEVEPRGLPGLAHHVHVVAAHHLLVVLVDVGEHQRLGRGQVPVAVLLGAAEVGGPVVRVDVGVDGSQRVAVRRQQRRGVVPEAEHPGDQARVAVPGGQDAHVLVGVLRARGVLHHDGLHVRVQLHGRQEHVRVEHAAAVGRLHDDVGPARLRWEQRLVLRKVLLGLSIVRHPELFWAALLLPGGKASAAHEEEQEGQSDGGLRPTTYEKAPLVKFGLEKTVNCRTKSP
mmetsp:Transcript_43986/g.72087  ORF Transcript_43986/g.72087 Transcript_43986/m.72087 type:complete len:870 (-) Transcript_43986:76-2685(-)